MRKQALIGIIVSYFFVNMNAMAAVTASVNRNPIAEGETVELSISIDAQTQVEVDLAPLQQDFEVLGQSSSQNISVINGRQVAISRQIITLMPKRRGELTIPSLGVGSERTEAIRLSVKQAASTRTGSHEATEFIAELSSGPVYVQSQLILTLRLSSSENIVEASIDQFNIANAHFKQLGEQKRFSRIVGGVSYDVIEIAYGIFPQKSGQLMIPSITFNGGISDSTRSGTFGGFFDRGASKRVRKKTIPSTVMVKAVPADYPQDAPWLPLQQLTLSEEWSQMPPHFIVDQAIVRTFKVEAIGGGAAMLPPFSGVLNSAFKIYPDKKTPNEIASSEGITTVLTESQVIIPQQSGATTIPETKIVWFDTVNEKIMTAIVAAKTVEVDAAPNSSAQVEKKASEIERVPATAQGTGLVGEEVVAWKIGVLVLFLVALALTLWILALRKKLKNYSVTRQNINDTAPAVSSEHLKNARAKLFKAVKDRDATACAYALSSWTKIYYALPNLPALGDISRRTRNQQSQELILQLENELYGSGAANINFDGIPSIIEDLSATIHKKRTRKLNALPPLYPA